MAAFKKTLSIFLILTFILMMGAVQAQYDQDAIDMREKCRSEGAIVLVEELMKDDKKQQWKEIMQKIATGNSEWIDASACLSHGVQLGLNAFSDYAEATLAQSWAAALLENPEEMLKKTRELPLTVMCGLPLDWSDGSVEFADDFLNKALIALERVEKPYLRPGREACAVHLKFDHERFINQIKNGH